MSYTGRGEGHYQLYLLRQTQPPLLAIYKHTSSGFLIGQFDAFNTTSRLNAVWPVILFVLPNL
jgi:hypothetical protein